MSGRVALVTGGGGGIGSAVAASLASDGNAVAVADLRLAAAELKDEVRRWADEMLALSPTALRFIKQSFNTDTEHMAGIGQLAFSGLHQFVATDEAREGIDAFAAKRTPDFAAYRGAASR